MSTFDIRNDAPGLLRAESLNMTLKFDRTSASTGRVSWNIPTPAQGCLAGTQAYNGIVVVLDTVSPSVHHKPIHGTVYQADNNVDENLFAGDKIGTSKVVGTFYGDTTTTYFDVEGLTANTPYYISGYPVDAQYRYYVEGVHAFSQNHKNGGSDSTNGHQVVVFNPQAPKMGVKLSDATQLTPSINYSFDMKVGYVYPIKDRPLDSTECRYDAPTYTINVNGSYCQTFQELLNEINKNIALAQGSFQSPLPPNTGAFYVNDGTLYQWDGSQHVLYSPFVNVTTQPNITSLGALWYTPSSKLLQVWNEIGSPSVGSWNAQSYIKSAFDPTQPIQNVTYWFNGITTYLWNGVAWCESYTYFQASDPSLAPIMPEASYWYDNVNFMLYKYDNVLDMWNTVDAIQYHIDPNSLPVGTYWFSDSLNKLFVYDTTWTELTNTTISENEPATPAANRYWFDLKNNELFQRNSSNTEWIQLDVLVYPDNPQQRLSCDTWWNTETDQLFVWDKLNSVWVQITTFYQQPIDPSLPPTMNEGNLWYDGIDLYEWNGNCFIKVDTVVMWDQDPTNLIPGTIWHNTITNIWKVLAGSPPAWSDLSVPLYETEHDPYNPSINSAWYNPSNSTLSIWNGIAWIPVSYSSQPLTPTSGTLWYDTTTALLKQWSNGWILTTPFVICEHDCNGNFKFTHTAVGSDSLVRITDGNLFESLSVDFKIHEAKLGEDGVVPGPMYEEIGVGTDGSNDERLQLHKELRYELGYPTIQVELTNEQLDYAISSALGELRQKSGAAVRHGFFFIEVPANTHTIYMTNKNKQHNKIVDIMGVYRATSSFLSSAHSAGVYGQIVLQHLYNMGTFDLLSFHIMNEYTKLMEILFAARVVFTFNEHDRSLHLFNRFAYTERMVCVEATVERTEQELLVDRRLRPWIRRYASAMCRMMLAESRGKFSTLPGANGSVTLNAAELRQQAQTLFDQCTKEIDDQIVDNYQQYGVGSTFVFG